jgi:hypothetical protein
MPPGLAESGREPVVWVLPLAGPHAMTRLSDDVEGAYHFSEAPAGPGGAGPLSQPSPVPASGAPAGAPPWAEGQAGRSPDKER